VGDIWIPSAISALGAIVVVCVQFYLNGKSNERIELLRSDLTQRRSIFERRANVLTTVYAKLVDANEAYEDFLNSGTRFAYAPGPEELQRAAVEAGEGFRSAFTRPRILIPKNVATLLDEINRQFVGMAKAYVVGRSIGQDENQALMNVHKSLEGKVQTARSDIERAFRDAIEGRN
jgi:hypothetical protein